MRRGCGTPPSPRSIAAPALQRPAQARARMLAPQSNGPTSTLPSSLPRTDRAANSLHSLSPFGERVGVRGLRNYQETSPHPSPSRSRIDFGQLNMPNSSKSEFGGRGSGPRSCQPSNPSRDRLFEGRPERMRRVDAEDLHLFGVEGELLEGEHQAAVLGMT